MANYNKLFLYKQGYSFLLAFKAKPSTWKLRVCSYEIIVYEGKYKSTYALPTKEHICLKI